MKFLKIKQSTLERIISDNLNYLAIVEDKDDLTVDDQIEFFNEDNVSFGNAIIDQVRVMRHSDIDKSDNELVAQLQELGDVKTGSDDNHVKVIHFKFNEYPEPHSISNDDDIDVEFVKIFTDGGSRGNPGPSASGYVIMTMSDEIIKSVGVYLGITTNNQAEYKALKFALEDGLKLGAKTAEVYMDSLLAVNQLNGIFKIKNRDLLPIYEDIKNLKQQFDQVTFTHVPRELNKLADAEVNKCLDAQVN